MQKWSEKTQSWAGLSFDLLSELNWGIGETLAESTYETVGIDFKPSVDLYGYAYAYFGAGAKWLGFEVILNSAWFDAQLIQAHYRRPITMPDWWAASETPQKSCFGVSQGLNPVNVEIGLNLWYPVCQLSLTEFLS